MRIIAGGSKGRRVQAPPEPGLRPISARIKKSLFDVLKEMLPGAAFLDLFAGSGAVGLEALSRGAASAFFVEQNPRCRAAIEKNLAKSGFAGRGKAHPGSALEDLSWIPFRSGVSRFDIIFLGPPYKDEEKRPLAYTTPALARVAESELLSPGGVVVSQRHIKEKVEAPPGLELVRSKKYGDTVVEFYRVRRGGGAGSGAAS